jgi:hypothetical protein
VARPDARASEHALATGARFGGYEITGAPCYTAEHFHPIARRVPSFRVSQTQTDITGRKLNDNVR